MAESLRRKLGRINLNQERAASLQSPAPGPAGATRRIDYFDDRIRGLALTVTSNGARIFYIIKRIDGRPCRYRLGRFPDLTVEAARRMAAEKLGQIAKGENPTSQRRELRAALTFGEAADAYIEHAKKIKRSWAEDERRRKVHLAGWDRKRLIDVSTNDVAALHETITTDRGPIEANRVRSLLSGLFTWAGMKPREWVKVNPVRGTRKNAEGQGRERYLSRAEVPRLLTALADASDAVADTAAMALWTAQRRSNICRMRWDQIDFDQLTWRIPAAEFKGKRDHVVDLLPEAVAILTKRKGNGSEWVFPGRSKEGHFVGSSRQWDAVREAAKLGDIHFHDLRRTMPSHSVMNGASESVAAKMLGHAPGSRATAVYARIADREIVRRAMEKAAGAMNGTAAKE